MTQPFSVVVAARDADLEYNVMPWTLASAFYLFPDEILFVLDKPAPERMKRRALAVNDAFTKLNRNGFTREFRILEVERTPDWNFHQAKVYHEAYKQAKNDIIFAYDIDNVLFPNVIRKGLDYVGKDNTAVVSFGKFLKVTGLPSFIGAVYYHAKRKFYPIPGFTGIYWMYRPWYFDLVNEEELKAIGNGYDTYLVDKIQSQDKYKLLKMRDCACYSTTKQNEDLLWRQFLNGVFLASHRRFKSQDKKIDLPGVVVSTAKTVIFGRAHMFKGYLWAREHPNDPICEKAREFETLHEFQYLGNISRGYGEK